MAKKRLPEPGTSREVRFPINQKLRIIFDLDLDWNDPLAEDPDSKLEEKRLHLIDNSPLLKKLFGLAALRQLYEYLSQMENGKELFGFDEEDLLWAANLQHMNNETIFDELMWMNMGFGDESIYKILSTDAFTNQVNHYAIMDRHTDETMDMGPIQNPLIMEQDHHYLIGQGNGEIMVMVSSILENEDITSLKELCLKAITQAKVLSSRAGDPVARMGIAITTTLEDTAIIQNAITTYCNTLVSPLNLYIHMNKIDRILKIDNFFHFMGMK